MAADTLDDRDRPAPDCRARPSRRFTARRAKETSPCWASCWRRARDIDERADLEHDNGPHLNGLTTLMAAARLIDGATVDTLRWLVERGADVRATSEGGGTAAWYAAGHGGRWEFHARAVTPDHAERLRYLLDLGLDPDECNLIGRSLIAEACDAGDPARVGLLLERGASARVSGRSSHQPSLRPACGCRRVPPRAGSKAGRPGRRGRNAAALDLLAGIAAGRLVHRRGSSGTAPRSTTPSGHWTGCGVPRRSAAGAGRPARTPAASSGTAPPVPGRPTRRLDKQ
jgi:ankyrin repeat protein